jgi:DNA-binding PadR family transcriptional regulator
MSVQVVRLLVLGAIRAEQPAHGYAVQRLLERWRVETWTRVRPGSIYHAISQAERQGRLRVARTEKGAGGPGRTLYELTDAGEAEFHRLLAEAMTSLDLEELGAAVAFMTALPRPRALELLREQHDLATRTVANLSTLRVTAPPREEQPHTLDLLELWQGSVAATATWSTGLIARLEAGDYAMADDPPASSPARR